MRGESMVSPGFWSSYSQPLLSWIPFFFFVIPIAFSAAITLCLAAAAISSPSKAAAD